MKEYLYEKNQKCEKCRWCTDNVCQNISSEYYCKDIEFEDTNNCEQYYPLNDMELFESKDEDTNSLFD